MNPEAKRDDEYQRVVELGQTSVASGPRIEMDGWDFLFLPACIYLAADAFATAWALTDGSLFYALLSLPFAPVFPFVMWIAFGSFPVGPFVALGLWLVSFWQKGWRF